MKKIGIYGAGGHGKVVADIARRSGYSLIEFFDDVKKSGTKGVWNIQGDLEALRQNLKNYDEVIVAIGSNRIRLEKTLELMDWGARLATLIDPQAIISEDVKIEAGTVIMPGAIINIGTQVGMACVINTGATVDHDCKLLEGAHISPGAHLAGEVKVGKHSWVGIGSSVIQKITIDDNVVVGAGSVVIKDVACDKKVVGVPARDI